jgi:hypothetical protein
VSKRRAHRSVPSVEPGGDDDDKTTLWVRGHSSAFPLVPKERPSPLVPRDRSSDSKVAVALTKTLRPIAASLRWFPLAYVLSASALVVAGLALYFARITGKPPIDVMSLPVAPPAPRAKAR